MSLVPRALNVVEVALDNEDVTVQLRAARQIVDQTGKLDQAARSHEPHTTMSDEQIAEWLTAFTDIAMNVMTVDQQTDFVERQRSDERFRALRAELGIPDPKDEDEGEDDGLLPAGYFDDL